MFSQLIFRAVGPTVERPFHYYEGRKQQRWT